MPWAHQIYAIGTWFQIIASLCANHHDLHEDRRVICHAGLYERVSGL